METEDGMRKRLESQEKTWNPFTIRYLPLDCHWAIMSPLGVVVDRCPTKAQAVEWCDRYNKTARKYL